MHLACPIVCAPERATRSLTERPCAWNRLMRLLRVDDGEGMTPLLAADRLAVLESRLPSLILHAGPPNCREKT